METNIQQLIIKAADTAKAEVGEEVEPQFTQKVKWPITSTVGPGLEGAIACESAVGYVNGTAGKLIYRGYDIFDLCAHAGYEEVSYLLLHGELPNAAQLRDFKEQLVRYRSVPMTLRQLMALPIEGMNGMAALRLGTLLLRQTLTSLDTVEGRPSIATAISADEDSIPMELMPRGSEHATYEFDRYADRAANIQACYHLIAALPTIVAAIYRVRAGLMPIEPDPTLGHAANFLYMLRGERPSKTEEKIMDVALILHADHGMNASTFATLVVASTLSDIYFSVGAGIAALNGPLHGGANEEVTLTLKEIAEPQQVKPWLQKQLAKNKKVPGFGHRVYKAYDPRARILGPLAKALAGISEGHRKGYEIAEALEREMAAQVGSDKKVFPNVDYYSGLVYSCMGIEPYLFTPIFAVSRVAGWTARTVEYLENNRIFRPRAVYTGEFGKEYTPIEER